MTSRRDIREVVDELLATEKSLAGLATWVPNAREGDVRLVQPLLVAGEVSDATLTIIAYPRSSELRFRIVLVYQRAVWRLDYTRDEVHINPADCPSHLPVEPITEPHFHSWRDNRHLATFHSLPMRLKNANLLTRNLLTFPNAFRWFCGETMIRLGTHDVPDLPPSDRLL